MPTSAHHPSVLNRIAYCVLPALLGAGAALVLLFVASGPAGRAYADTLTFPGACGGTIQACIDGAGPGDMILISAGDYTESLTLSKAVSLTGALSSTTILHALPNTRVLTVTGAAVDSSVVISGLTFMGGQAISGGCPDGCGGGIALLNSAQPLLRNLRLISNTALTTGGGLYAGAAAISGSLFQDNVCTQLYCQGGGLTTGSLVLTATQFIHNVSRSNGGGAYASGVAVVSGGLFQANACTQPYPCRGGGLYAASTLGLVGSQFISNSAPEAGGGVYVEGAAALTDSNFLSNTSGYAGGIYALSVVTVTGGSLVGNSAGGSAGGLLAVSAATVSGTQFLSNTAQDYDGGGLAVFGAVVLTNTRFVSNTAGSAGGGLYAIGDATLSQVDFISNTVNDVSCCGGGGLSAGGAVTMTGGSFVGNKAIAVSTGGEGGGLLAGTSAVLSGTRFINNTAASGGGLIATQAILTGTQFVGNTAGGLGGGLSASNVMLTGSSFISNTAASRGGGLNVYSATLADSSFISNTAGNLPGLYDDGGGAVFAIDAITLTGDSFVGNLADQYGGGLYAGASAILTDTRFVSNSAGFSGGGLYALGAVALTGTQFVSNTARIDGGGVYFGDGSTGQRRLVNSLLAGNRAARQGDGLLVNLPASSALILESTFADRGLAPGAAIYVVTGTVGITDTIIASYTVGISVTTGNVFQDYNLFFGNGTNTTGAASGGAHSLIGDPLFASPAAGDFHLGVGSAALDVGVNAGVTTDFEGDPRPLGPGFDMGFDESPITAQVDVGITKSASDLTRQPGQTITYTLVFSNAGPDIAAGVSITDIVPANLVAISTTNTGVELTPVGSSNYAWQAANLAPGAGGVITVTGVLSGGLGGTAFTNTASISTAYPDSNLANDTSAVSVTVANVAPVAVGDVYLMAPNSTLTVTAPGVLANDSDGNNDVLTATLSAGPLTGTLSLHANGSFAYTPPLNFGGTVTFTYRANDSQLLSAPATVTVTVNQFPLANAGPSQLYLVGQQVTLDGSASADPDHNLPLVYGWHQSGGTAVVLSSATISRPTFTAPTAPAVLTFTLTVTDAFGLASLPATTTVTVADQAITGLGAAGGSPRVLGAVTLFTATLSAGTNVSYTWGFGDGSLPGSGALASHTYALPGVFQAVVTATNSAGQVTATTTVTVDDIPLAAGDTYTTPEDTPLHVAAPGVLANDTDLFPGGLTAQWVPNPLTGTLVLAPSGAFTYTPPLNFNGPVTFTYRAGDGTLSSPPATVTITVTAVNDPPSLTAPADVTTTAGTPVGPLSFTMGDVETPAGALTVTAQSSNTALVPNSSIVLGGSGAARTVTITPTPALTGAATITLGVSDGLAVTNQAFTLTVTSAGYKLYLPLLQR